MYGQLHGAVSVFVVIVIIRAIVSTFDTPLLPLIADKNKTLVILTFGFQFFGQSNAFGLITHLVPMAIAFILYLIGVSSLTALTDKIDCGNVSQSFTRCSIVKGLVVISWIDT